MSVFNALEFDGINSLDYGIYITGEAAFNSPQRAVEAVTVPGRNGDILLDQGHYENIEVTYHAGVFGVDQSEFASKIQTFRNLLASRIGYKRITDTYNTGEYRLGTFIAPVDVLPDSYNRVGEFDIVFNCKPQRFLTSGETAITVADGDTVTNPTYFDSQPLLEIEGYGDIKIGDALITINNELVGSVVIGNALSTTSPRPAGLIWSNLSVSLLNTGDSITVSGSEVEYVITASGGTVQNLSVSSATGLTVKSASIISSEQIKVTIVPNTETFNYGTSRTSTTASVSISYTVVFSGGGSSTYQKTISHYVDYDGAKQIYIHTPSVTNATWVLRTQPIMGDSTKSALTQPVYIDLAIGEAYGYISGDIVSLNSNVEIPSDLPTLAPNGNTFELDNTITDLKVTPRWWML